MRIYPRPGLTAWLLLMAAPAAFSQGEDHVLANRHLRVHLRPNLTLSVDDLATQVTWGSDPWENSAGRVHLRGRHGESITVSLGAATQKKSMP